MSAAAIRGAPLDPVTEAALRRTLDAYAHAEACDCPQPCKHERGYGSAKKALRDRVRQLIAEERKRCAAVVRQFRVDQYPVQKKVVRQIAQLLEKAS